MKIKGYCIGLLGLLLVACQREEVVSPWETGGSDGDLQLQLSTKGLMNRYVVTTKGTDVKTSEEQEIKTLHVFLFDEDGNYLKAKDENRYQNYIAGGRTVINIDRQGWEDEEKASNATVVVVANVEDGTFQYASTSQPRDFPICFYKPTADEHPRPGFPPAVCLPTFGGACGEESAGERDADVCLCEGGGFY